MKLRNNFFSYFIFGLYYRKSVKWFIFVFDVLYLVFPYFVFILGLSSRKPFFKFRDPCFAD